MSEIKFKFEDLKVYQKSLEFVDFVYATCDSFPSNEKYALSSQFTRAAVSIALNIAEGSSDSDKQFNRYLQIAIDSVNECVVCSSISKRQNYISNEKEIELREKLVELSKMISGLQKYLKTKLTSKN